MSPEDTFKKCSTCREPILFEQKYWACSVSTCNRSKLALYFCSLPCWEAHVPEARHRDAWAEERKAPTRAAHLADSSNASAAQSEASRATKEAASAPHEATRAARVVSASPLEPARAARIVGATANTGSESDDDVLVVVSKLKKYIRDQSGMNTSDGAMGPISDHLRTLCRDAIRHASEDGRKTVMDRDFLPFLHRR